MHWSGSDLTVRDCRVWLKTLERLQPVDVILRRVDDICCDPLELRGDSLLGTPGLLQAARAGHVVIANLPGSGLLENPGLMPFLPTVCRYLLEGAELALGPHLVVRYSVWPGPCAVPPGPAGGEAYLSPSATVRCSGHG
jgi:uncharacterized circularly permuted ATP-grasp superfamily protein